MNVGKRRGKLNWPLFRVLPALSLTLALLTGCTPQPQADLGSLETQIRQILELPTVDYFYRDIVYLGSSRSFLFFKTMDKKLLFSVRIRVRAGLDLGEGFRVIPDDNNPRRVYVQLPPSRILGLSIDERGIHQYFQRGQSFGRLEYTAAIEEIKPRAQEDALKRGILQKSDHKARAIIHGIFSAAGFTQVDFLPPRKEEALRG